MKYLLMVLVLCSSASAWRGGHGAGGRSGMAVDSFDVRAIPVGARIDMPQWDRYLNLAASPAEPAFTVVPLSGYQAVQLIDLHLNPESDAVTARPSARDSSKAYFRVMLIGFIDATADTLTENVGGLGGYIPYSGFTGYLSPPKTACENDWSTLTSHETSYNWKTLPTTTRCAVRGDSIQVWLAKWIPSTATTQDVYYRYKRASLPSLSGLLTWQLHIQYTDTALCRWDYVPLAFCHATQRAFLAAWFFDLGPRYTVASDNPWQGSVTRPRATSQWDDHQLENNTYFFENDRPIVTTTLTDTVLASVADQNIYLKCPIWWDKSYSSFEEYWPGSTSTDERWGLYLRSGAADSNGGVLGGQATAWWHTGSILSSSALDTPSGIWRIQLDNNGSAIQGLTVPPVAYQVGDSVKLTAGNRSRVRGTEDIPGDGYYGYQAASLGQLLQGDESGVLVDNSAGWDSLLSDVTTEAKHWAAYLVSFKSPISFPAGFSAWYQKSFVDAATTGLTWRLQSTIVYYTFNVADLSVVPPIVRVDSANGGEDWLGFSEQQVSWVNLGGPADSYDIKLSDDGGSSFSTTLATGIWGAATEWTWTVVDTANASAICLIKVIAHYGASTVADSSDAVFAITMPVWSSFADSVVCYTDSGLGVNVDYDLACAASGVQIAQAPERVSAQSVSNANNTITIERSLWAFDLQASGVSGRLAQAWTAGSRIDSIKQYLWQGASLISPVSGFYVTKPTRGWATVLFNGAAEATTHWNAVTTAPAWNTTVFNTLFPSTNAWRNLSLPADSVALFMGDTLRLMSTDSTADLGCVDPNRADGIYDYRVLLGQIDSFSLKPSYFMIWWKRAAHP